MKKLSFVVAAAVAAVLSSCGGSAVQSAAGVDVPSEVKVADAMIPMVNVEGGTFAMGKTPSGVRISGATVHQGSPERIFDLKPENKQGRMEGRDGLRCRNCDVRNCTCGYGLTG